MHMYIYAYDIHTYMMFMTYKCGFIHNSYCIYISVYQHYAHYPNRCSYIFICTFIYHTQYSYSYTRQHTATHACTYMLGLMTGPAATHCNTHCHTLQHTATHRYTCIQKIINRASRNTLQHVATHCNTLQHAATHRKTHIHMYTRANRRGQL